MAPTLDLSNTNHAKMLVLPPRMNLRKAASYNHDRGPQSSTSSRFNFNHFVFSPPPSPGLPASPPVPRRPPKGFRGFIRPRRLVRLVIWTLGAVLVFHVASPLLKSRPEISSPRPVRETHEGQGQVVQSDLQDVPTAVVIHDKRGKAKWTVSIPSSFDFPLSPSRYYDICLACKEVSQRLMRSRSHTAGLQSSQDLFGSIHDPYFVDVAEAEEGGILPGLAGESAQSGKQRQVGSLVGENTESSDKPLCQKSLVFVMESSDAGLGKSLMMLWVAYALAVEEARAFFIDDTRWAYGKYTDIFQAPPSPGCRAPPRHEMVPCPRQARHLIVSAATAKEVFGSVFEQMTLDKHARRTVFDLARTGHDALFKLNKDDAAFVEFRTRELLARRTASKISGTNGVVVGMHVRRGDCHPLEHQYRDSYIPTNKYAETVHALIDGRLSRGGGRKGGDVEAKAHSVMILASDDPLVYETEDFAGAVPAQELIKLASKARLQEAAGDPINADKHVMHKPVDDAFGWEGGFFAAMFWHLGMPGPSNSAAAKSLAGAKAAADVGPASIAAAMASQIPSTETVRLRSLVGRSYMMDLAILANASDMVVCTVSSAGCRILGVLMGWDSMVQGNWVNIDGTFTWRP